MRLSRVLIWVAGALLTWPAASQTLVAGTAQTFASATDVEALVARAKAASRPPGVVEDIVSLAPYTVHLEYRTAASPAKVHESDAELFYVLDGTGEAITGGTLESGQRTDAANLSGPGITGGSRKRIAKGDVLIVPQGAPHQFLPDSVSPLVLLSLHLPRPVGVR